MKEIGEFLKQKRLEKGLTIDQIVEKTRMPATRVKALEEGDINLFKDDLTYLQFFVQAYCKALGIDDNEIKKQVNESVNGYTTTFQAEQLRKINESEQHIREKSNKRIEEYKRVNQPKNVKRKIDFSLISFIVVVCLLVSCLIFVGGKFVKDYLFNEKPPVDEIPNVPDNKEEEDDKPQIDDIPNKEEEIIKEIEVIQNADNVAHFDVMNATKPFIVKVEFVPSSHFELLYDGQLQSKPQRRIYDAGTVLEIEIDPAAVKEVTLNFGFFWKMKVSVDGKAITFDDSIALHEGREKIVLNIKGGTQ